MTLGEHKTQVHGSPLTTRITLMILLRQNGVYQLSGSQLRNRLLCHEISGCGAKGHTL